MLVSSFLSIVLCVCVCVLCAVCKLSLYLLGILVLACFWVLGVVVILGVGVFSVGNIFLILWCTKAKKNYCVTAIRGKNSGGYYFFKVD